MPRQLWVVSISTAKGAFDLEKKKTKPNTKLEIFLKILFAEIKLGTLAENK
jgi:hypothetical protein